VKKKVSLTNTVDETIQIAEELTKTLADAYRYPNTNRHQRKDIFSCEGRYPLAMYPLSAG